jgi:thioredoxin-like negative regulator of GroEL
MRRRAALLAILLLALRAATALGQTLDLPLLGRADALVREGRAEEAWQLLLPLEPEHAGNPEFDYLLAVAALESGKPNRATFILERVVATNPGHVAARLEMARALFALGDFERAERELDVVLASNPPPAVVSLAMAYRERMRDAPLPGSTVSGYAEIAIGRDTNVTAGSRAGSIFIPSLGTDLILDPLFTRQADQFTAVGAGVQFSRPLSGSTALIAGGDLRRRLHSSLDVLDWQAVDVHLGLQHRRDARDSVRVVGHLNEYELDRSRYRSLQTATAEWTRAFGDRARVSVSMHGARIRYLTADTRASSSDLLGLGADATYVVDAATRTLAFGGVYAGHDNAVAGRADGDRRLYGASGGFQRRLSARVEGYASLALLNSDYRDVHPSFGVVREDRQLDLAFGASWDIGRGWFLRPQLVHTRNVSNLQSSDYQRTEGSLALQYVWP